MVLVIVVKCMRFGKAGAKRCGGNFKGINWNKNASQKRENLFLRKESSRYVILLYCETLL